MAWDFENSAWLQTLEPGTLVRPIHVIRLTPIRDVGKADNLGPEWTTDQIGIVLPSFLKQLGIIVLVPSGVGVCFSDEVKKLT